jgi:carbon monoxide dehydrogenase subunit G
MKTLFTESGFINKRIDEVFEFVSNPENIPHFIPAVVRCEKLDDAKICVGSKLLETRKVFNKEATAQVEVSRYERNKIFAIKSENKGVFGEYVYEFTSEVNGTRLSITAFANVSGIMKIFSPIFTIAMKKDAKQVGKIIKSLEKS